MFEVDEFLRGVGATLNERQEDYQEPTLFLNILARRWSTIFDTHVTSQQVAIALADMKIARLTRNPHHRDSARDLAGYAALLSLVQD